MGIQDVTVFRHRPEDIPELPYPALAYRPLRNLYLDRPAWQAFRRAETALWAVGLDMQDDSSLVRLLYLWVVFRMYRILGLRIICLFQGAGPINTPVGRLLARLALAEVDTFVARDPGTFALIKRLRPQTNTLLAHDAIFLPGFEQDIKALLPAEENLLAPLVSAQKQPTIGINLRQWFHFTSSLLPYQFAQTAYRRRSEKRMEALIDSMAEVIVRLRAQRAARILLISAYQPGVVPWEDDLPWLSRLKSHFANDENVLLVDSALSLPAYYALMSRLDLMIGMRLHSALIALRFGVPAINLSYTLKGGDIMNALGLKQNVIDLDGFLENPQAVSKRALAILSDWPAEHDHTLQCVEQAIQTNMALMQKLFNR
jgi:polysaccharide pyruvyl transferase WcaK-like protein